MMAKPTKSELIEEANILARAIRAEREQRKNFEALLLQFGEFDQIISECPATMMTFNLREMCTTQFVEQDIDKLIFMLEREAECVVDEL